MTNAQLIDILQNVEDVDTYLEELSEIDDNSTMTINESLLEWFDNYNFTDDEERIIALMQHTEDDYAECSARIEDESYLVLMDSEADALWEDYLEDYIDDIVLPELPEHLQTYFDRESWMDDARMDGRGHSLSTYDGNEYSETVGKTTYYIYRR